MKKILIVLAQITLKLKLKILWIPIYHTFNRLVIYSIQEKNLYIWPRNSFVSKALIPPLSDLDYTIIYNSQKISKTKLVKKISFAKKISPLFKEANVYQEQQLHQIVSFINPYELKRDPLLKRYLEELNLTVQKETKSHALVFILKAFNHDYIALSKHPELRLSRWENLFSLIDQEVFFTHDLKRSISQTICNLAEIQDQSTNLLKFIESDFNFSLKNVDVFSFLFPIKYIIYCFNSHIPLKFPISSLSAYQQEVLLEIFKWEVSGLLSQAYLQTPHEHYIKHLDNLYQLLSTGLCPKNLLEIENSLQTFSRLLCVDNGKSI